MAKLSFRIGISRISIEADSEEKLAAYLGELVSTTIARGCKDVPAGVVIAGNTDQSWGWPIALETPERNEIMTSSLRKASLHGFIRSKHGHFCAVCGYGGNEPLKHPQENRPS